MVAPPPPPPLASLQLPTLLRHRGCLLVLHSLDPPAQLNGIPLTLLTRPSSLQPWRLSLL